MAGDRNKFQVAITHAQRFAEQGNWSEAIKAYRFALAEFPNDQEAIIGFGRATFSAGQVDLAQKAFLQALKLNPSNYQALLYMGEIQEQKGELHAAAESYLRAGNVCAAEEDYYAALEAWRQVIELVPDHIDAHHKLAQGLVWQDQPRQAARQLLTVAAIYQEREDYEQAMQQLQEAQELIGDDPGLVAAFEALRQGEAIEPDQISESPPVDILAEEDPLFLADFMDTYTPEEVSVEEEEDPFAIEAEPEDRPTGGLVEAAQKEAMAELANAIFEDSRGSESAGVSSDELNMLIVQGIDLQSRDNLTEAVNNYRQAIQGGITRPALYFNLGLLSKELGQYDEAIKMLQASTQAEKYGTASHFVLGRTYQAIGNQELALKHFLEAVKQIDLETVDSHRSERLANNYEKLADSYLTQGDDSRISSFVSAVENYFSHPAWRRRTYEARQRMDSISAGNGSVMSLAEFLETPETEVVVTALAVTSEFMKRNLLLTASEECLRAIQRAPSYLPLHARLAEILLKQEHTDAAIAKYLYIIKVYEMRNQLDQAIDVYQKILRLAPMDVTVRSKLIDLYISNKNFDEALDEYLILANSYYQLAQVDRALEKYNEALRLTANVTTGDSWKTQILGEIGDIYNQRFDWARATSAFEQLLEINPGDERTLRQLVDLYFKQRKTDQAFEVLDRLLALYRRQNQSEKTMELLKDLVTSYPGNTALRQRLAAVYVESGMKEAAIAEYDAIGEMQLEDGLLDEATKTIQAILKLEPADPEGYRRLLAQISGGAV